MIRRAAILALALDGTAAQADPRIATRLYEPNAVVVLHGRAGIESTIAFGDDEHIENVAVGNSDAWQVTPNKRANLLFVKPAGARAHTNMTVVTDLHTYLFDLVSVPGAATYMLRFTYPATAKAKPIEVARAVPAPAPVAEAPPPTEPAPDPATLNFGWTSKGDRRLLPARSFDDGRSTYLQWPKDVTLPAILMLGAGGQEGPVNFTVRGDTIVVDGVPPEIILRAGRQMAILTPAPRGAASTDQTASARP